jgi:hypothetical protein
MTTRTNSVTRVTGSKAFWAVEIEQHGAEQPEYFSVVQLRADETQFEMLTISGKRVVFGRDTIRKILVMRTVAASKA